MDAGLVAILVGLIAAGAALIGSRLTSQANEKTLAQAAALERSRWDREDARRHEEARRQSYHAFLATVDEGVHGLNRQLATGNFDAEFAGPHWQERLRDALNLIEFVGSEETIDLAKLLDRAVHRLLAGVVGIVRANDPAGAGDQVMAEDEIPLDDDPVEVPNENEDLGDTSPDDEVVNDPDQADDLRPATLQDLNAFMLPYPLGEERAPESSYWGIPTLQVVMARAELRVRRHEFINAARRDLGMPEVPFPSEGLETPAPEEFAVEEPANAE